MNRREFTDSTDLASHVADISGDEVILSFSGGKDALGAWIHLRRHFSRVIPYHYYLVPGLSFVEDGLRMYEDFFQTPIIRLPSVGLYRMMRNYVYQPASRIEAIQAMDLPVLTNEKIEQHVRDAAMTPSSFVAVGSRVADSVARRARIKKFGPCNHSARKFQAIYDWDLDRLEMEIRGAGAKLAPYYRHFASSFDGIAARWLVPMREHYPDDYRKVIEWFPLAETDILRHQYATEWEQRHAE